MISYLADLLLPDVVSACYFSAILTPPSESGFLKFPNIIVELSISPYNLCILFHVLEDSVVRYINHFTIEYLGYFQLFSIV